MSNNNTSALITASSGKAAEIKGFAGVFSCLLEHEVTKTKATFDYTGPKIKPELWAQVMEFFEWTYETEKSESQVRLFVHPVHGWAAWAFPQEGGTYMTSKELPLDTPEAAEQRKQFAAEDGWLYWGTVHHHCSTGAFASGTDDANEQSQEGLHITIGHMDKAMRDIHCRMYIKGHRFEPMMHKFWQLDGVILDKADEMFDLFGIYPDLNKAARMAMCQNSAALYAACEPPWVAAEGSFLFPPQWKENYKVRPRTVYTGGTYQGNFNRTDGKDWCSHCQEWVYHLPSACPNKGQSKKEKRKLRYQAAKKQLTNGSPAEDKKVSKAATMLDDLSQQAAVMGFSDLEFCQMIEALAAGNNGALMEVIMENLIKEKLKPEDLYVILLEQEIKAEQMEKASDRQAVQQQLEQANGGGLTGWEGYMGD